MKIFFVDIEIAKSILAMIASHSASLLETGKSGRMACSIISAVRALSYSPNPAPICHETPSTFKVHQPVLSYFISC